MDMVGVNVYLDLPVLRNHLTSINFCIYQIFQYCVNTKGESRMKSFKISWCPNSTLMSDENG